MSTRGWKELRVGMAGGAPPLPTGARGVREALRLDALDDADGLAHEPHAVRRTLHRLHHRDVLCTTIPT